MINYFNFKKFKDSYLITNDVGRYMFLPHKTLADLIQDRVSRDDCYYDRLYENYFISREHPEVFINRVREPLRCSKSYLFQSACLHIFVVTGECNLDCIYCQAHDCKNKRNYEKRGNNGEKGRMMGLETAVAAAKTALGFSENNLTFEFQGGEPLMNFEIIKAIIEYSNENKGSKTIEYNVVTNLSLMSEEIMDYFIKNNVNISTSFDGDRILHTKNRPMKNGGDSYEKTVMGIERLRAYGGVSAIETTTRYTLKRYKELIDAYVSSGLESIFIRPLTKLGTAKARWNEIGYSTEEFNEFYRNCLDYIIELNLKGIRLREGHAVIFLNKIIGGQAVNYMELRSPCGASVGQVAYYWDGNVYTCDEGRMMAEMGCDMFRLGNVYSDNADSLMENNVCRAVMGASLTECMPGCCDCVYQPYCGVCPVINMAEYGDLYTKEAESFRCGIYKGMLDCIFEIIYNGGEKYEIIKSWIGG